MANLRDKRILLFQQRGWGKGIGRFLAKKLYEDGCVLGAVTFKKITHGSIIQQTNAKYDLIISNDEIISDPKKYLAGDDYSLEEICDALGVDSIWPIVSTVRWFARSYKDKYYYSFKQNVSDEVMVDYVKAAYKSARIFQEKFKPDAIIMPNFIDAFHIIFNLFFEKLGVPTLVLTPSRVSGVYISVTDFNESHGRFFERVEKLDKGLIKSPNEERSKKYIEDFRKKFKTPNLFYAPPVKQPFLKFLKEEILVYYLILKWYLEPKTMRMNYWPNVGPSIDYRPPKIMLRDHYTKKRYRRFAEKYDYYPFEKLNKFVYLPLQVQPEQALDTTAPFFNNQIELARLVALSLPNDYTLAVKEHPVMVDKRPPSYLEKLSRTPNVKLIDYRIPTEKILKKCAMVVSQNSTTVSEAAFYWKPAIQFGNLGTTLRFPNVFKHTDMTTLSSKIKEVLKVDLHNEEYERRLENYIAAAYDAGLEFNYDRIWELSEEGDMEKLWRFYKKELEIIL